MDSQTVLPIGEGLVLMYIKSVMSYRALFERDESPLLPLRFA
jgi:hypothetical protein